MRILHRSGAGAAAHQERSIPVPPPAPSGTFPPPPAREQPPTLIYFLILEKESEDEGAAERPPPARSRPFSRRLLQPLGFAVHGFSPPAPLPSRVWAWFQRGFYPFYWVLWSFCSFPPLPGAGGAAPLPARDLPRGHHNGSSRVPGPSPHPAPLLRLGRRGEVPVGALSISRSRSNAL